MESAGVEFDADKLAFVARISKQPWVEDSAKPGAQTKPKRIIKPAKRPVRPKKLVNQKPTKQPITREPEAKAKEPIAKTAEVKEKEEAPARPVEDIPKAPETKE